MKEGSERGQEFAYGDDDTNYEWSEECRVCDKDKAVHMRAVSEPNGEVANAEVKVVIAYVAHRRFDRGWTAGSSKPCHPSSSSSSSPSPLLYTLLGLVGESAKRDRHWPRHFGADEHRPLR